MSRPGPGLRSPSLSGEFDLASAGGQVMPGADGAGMAGFPRNSSTVTE
jgi:hypothetical protein